MRWTRTLIPTSKNDPADAQTISHKLLVRAGMIRQLTAGVYDFLPLGLRSLSKAADVVRGELQNIGAIEVLLPALQPLELWRQSGRDAGYGDNLFKLKDRYGRPVVLGPTHEEVVTELIRAYVDSYRQLPLSLFQIQTKFRDEFRPRSGLLRVREFLMQDAYSFHATTESLNQTYEHFRGAYERIFTRCGLPYVAVEAESGPIGGGDSHEFMVVCDAGEDLIVESDRGNYRANVERAAVGSRAWTFAAEPTGELTKLHTPDLPGIADVASFLKVRPGQMLKTLVFCVRDAHPDARVENLAHPNWLVAVVRGDHDVNESKLSRAAVDHFHIEQVTLGDSPEVRNAWAIGFVGPDAAVRNPGAVMLIDPDAAQDGLWVAGANQVHYHVKHFNWFRECGDRLADPRKVIVADIRNAVEGDPSPLNDGGVLRIRRAIEVGHTFQLGTRYSDALGATYLDDKSVAHPIIMGCYGIGIGRLLAAVVEANHDEHGIIWPASLAPYQVVLTPIRYDGEVKRVTDQLYEELGAAGIDTLLDDRDVRPGVKFADADLIGFPIRINIGERGLQQRNVELKRRQDSEARGVAIESVVPLIHEMLR
jgi:prolyl-tRNA synthetase